jgi:hypothetical protein
MPRAGAASGASESGIASLLVSHPAWSMLPTGVTSPTPRPTAAQLPHLVFLRHSGFYFPVALGAKVAAPERAVVALAGDGGFRYALPELATAVQYRAVW